MGQPIARAARQPKWRREACALPCAHPRSCLRLARHVGGKGAACMGRRGACARTQAPAHVPVATTTTRQGSGLSDGQWVTLGHNEADDLGGERRRLRWRVTQLPRHRGPGACRAGAGRGRRVRPGPAGRPSAPGTHGDRAPEVEPGRIGCAARPRPPQSFWTGCARGATFPTSACGAAPWARSRRCSTAAGTPAWRAWSWTAPFRG